MLGLELFPLGTAIVLCVFALLWLAVAVVVQRQSNAVDDGATGYTLISEPPTDHIDGHRGGPGVANTLRESLLRCVRLSWGSRAHVRKVDPIS